MCANQVPSRCFSVLATFFLVLPGSPMLSPLGTERIEAAPVRSSTYSSERFRSSVAQTAKPMMQMPFVLPLFIQDRQFTSTLVMVNGSNEATAADVTVTALDGHEIRKERVEFAPHTQRQVEIYSLLQSAVAPDTSGRITVMPSSGVKNMGILAQLSLTYLGSREPTYLDEETAMTSPEGSQILRAVADPGQGSPFVAITSLSPSAQHITVQCIGSGGAFSSKAVELGPEETLVTQACTDRTRHNADFQEVLGTAREESQGAVGIAISSDAMPGSFAAFGLASHKKEGDRFFSALNFVDPKMLRSPNTVFTGVPVGSATLLPGASFEPEVALANFSDKNLNVVVKYSRTSGEEPVVQDIAKLIIPANATRNVSLSGLQGDPDLKNSFLITSDGAPGELNAKLVTKSESGLYEAELLGKDEKDYMNGGTHPWSLDQGNESTVLLFNHSTDPQRFSVEIASGAAVWQQSYLLQPMETLSISLRELIEQRAKDKQGRTLPKSLASGEVSWFVPSPDVGHGRLLQSNRATAMARNFSCGQFYFICYVGFNQEIFNLLIGYTHEFAYLTLTICSNPYSPNCQPGNQTSFSQPDGGARYSWSSSNTSVAPISGGTGSSSVSVQGAAGGTSTITGHASDMYNCGGFGSGNVFIQYPASLSALSSRVISMTSYCNSDPSYSYGIVVAIQYQVLDQNNPPAPIASNALEPQEELLNVVENGVNQGNLLANWRDIGPSSYPSATQFTDANGQFWDAPYGACRQTTFTLTETQPISILLNGTRYPVGGGAVRTNNWSIQSTSSSHGSITNNSDVSQSQ